jgi:hypothetical protein
MSADGVLRLSRYDELLLSVLSDEWKTPVRVWRQIHELSDQHQEFMSCLGDVTMAQRLAAWASTDAVERALGPNPDRAMLASVYRLAKRGKQLQSGPLQLADAPRLPVGGTEAYAPGTPWVLLDDGKLVLT